MLPRENVSPINAGDRSSSRTAYTMMTDPLSVQKKFELAVVIEMGRQ